MLALFGIACVLVIAKIVWSNISVPASPEQRLVEMVQWTVGTVTTVALGLVGYNWISSTRSIDREQNLTETRFGLQDRLIDSKIDAAKDRITEAEVRLAEQQRNLNESLASIDSTQKSLRELQETIKGENDAVLLNIRELKEEVTIIARTVEESRGELAKYFAYDIGRRAWFALEAEDKVGALLLVCTGIIRTQFENASVRDIIMSDARKVLTSIMNTRPLMTGLDGQKSLGPQGRDAFATAQGIIVGNQRRAESGERDRHANELLDLLHRIQQEWAI